MFIMQVKKEKYLYPKNLNTEIHHEKQQQIMQLWLQFYKKKFSAVPNGSLALYHDFTCVSLKRFEFSAMASFTDGKSLRMRYCFRSETSFIKDSPARTMLEART